MLYTPSLMFSISSLGEFPGYESRLEYSWGASGERQVITLENGATSGSHTFSMDEPTVFLQVYSLVSGDLRGKEWTTDISDKEKFCVFASVHVVAAMSAVFLRVFYSDGSSCESIRIV